ncbi:MAG: crotonase/enoyl-CoA hydratase family protein [Acidimicrobiia bacterium]|nr:crotonase/enoyl-CoA hydratase family protein [Acidimicrobiia bacterium]
MNITEQSNEQAVLVERRGRVMIITLNRPEAMNAINGALSHGLWNAVQELNRDAGLTAGVLTGSGRGFCSGMDLKAFARGEDIGPMGTFIRAGCEKPLIAAIEGFAIAGGCELALTCDLLVAAAGAKIAIREVKVGLFAAGAGLFRLPSRVGYAKAMEMAITGDSITAEEAHAAGMITEVTEPGGALDAAVALAERVAQNAPLAVAASKKLVRAAAQGYDEEELWKMQEPLFQQVFTSNDAREGPAAFAEKREPKWSGT